MAFKTFLLVICLSTLPSKSFSQDGSLQCDIDFHCLGAVVIDLVELMNHLDALDFSTVFNETNVNKACNIYAELLHCNLIGNSEGCYKTSWGLLMKEYKSLLSMISDKKNEILRSSACWNHRLVPKLLQWCRSSQYITSIFLCLNYIDSRAECQTDDVKAVMKKFRKIKSHFTDVRNSLYNDPY